MKKRWPLLSTATLASAYLTWTVLDRPQPTRSPPHHFVEAIAIGDDAGRGAVVAVQPWFAPEDFLDGRRWMATVEQGVAIAAAQGLLPQGSVVVLPAHVGTGLVLVGEKRGAASLARFDDAARLVAASNLPAYLLRLAVRIGRDGGRSIALFRMKAAAMASVYNEGMSAIALKHRVVVVGGSIILPEPAVVAGRVVVGRGPLVEASFVFQPDGRAAPVVVHRRDADLDGARHFATAPKDEPSPSVVPTAAGRIGVLLSSDARDPAAWDAMARLGVDVVAVPSSSRRGAHGADLAMFAARLPATGARAGAVSALRGALFDFDARGASAVVSGQRTLTAQDVDGAVVLAAFR